MDHKNATLVVIGGASGQEGSYYESEIRDLANNLTVGKKVVFIPPQPHHILSSYYRAADIVIVPSRSESFGLVALEAAVPQVRHHGPGAHLDHPICVRELIINKYLPMMFKK